MLEKVSTILKMADESNTAVISFICTDYNMVYSVVTTAEKTNTPALVMLLPEHYEKNNTMNVHGFAEMVKELAESVKVPIGLHLDHSYDYDSVITSIKKGFDSVMIDASAYSLDENIALTRKVTETAHILGADVEAEIGHVGLAQDCDGDKTDYYTKADAAARFYQEIKLILWLLLSEMLMVFMWKRLIWIFRGLKKLMLLQMFHLYFMEAVGFLMTSWRLLSEKVSINLM